jgi:signal transduction histidine kinase
MAYLVTESNAVQTNIRQFVEGISSDPPDAIIAAVDRHTHFATAAILCPVICVLVQNLMLNAGFLYTRWIGLTNCTLPLGAVVATVVSPRSLLALPAFIIPLVALWMNVLHSVAQRKQFMAESRQRETEALEAQLRHAQADVESNSILDHHLKNIMAEVKGSIETFLEDRTADEHLHQALERLQSGIKWCKNRLVLIGEVSSEYVPQLTSVNLATLVQGLISGRQMPHVTFPDQSVWINENLCALMLENVIVNALRHGHPEGPAVSLHIDLQPEPRTAEHTITFRVTNRADPAKPRITPEFWLQASEGNHRLTSRGLSDGLGLGHIFMIAERLGAVASLTQAEGEDTVVFEASMPVRVCDDGHISVSSTAVPELPVPSAIQQRPWNLRFFCAEDSAVGRRLLAINLKRYFEGSSVEMFGATKDDLEGFAEAAKALADVVIVDQNMEYGETSVYGTDLLKQLTALGFGGLCCIRSADTSVDDRALYTSSGAHLTLDKGISFGDMALRLQDAYIKHVAFSAASAAAAWQ